MVHQVLYRALVSTKWLAESIRSGRLGPSLRVLDASWYSPGTRQARKEYQERHVPGASFFDIEECRDTTSPYEMMLPSEAHFGDYVGNLGISNDTHVVVYDGDDLGSFYAPRVWWMFRVFGHRTVSVLNGGFRNWLKEGHPVTSEPSRPEPAVFKATLNLSLLKTYEQVLENLQSKRFQLVDSRAQGRYLGTQPEPDIVGLDSGHIRGSVNMPFMDFLTKDGFEKSPEELRAIFLPLWQTRCGCLRWLLVRVVPQGTPRDPCVPGEEWEGLSVCSLLLCPPNPASSLQGGWCDLL
ncbi:thiosulfate sulfurtransferase, mitochondrial, isoform CRA_b [Mus musculus]|nr:thiosulfate sulfurtransferase, mitochondrial, isoform CRA_b [Mus musculus]